MHYMKRYPERLQNQCQQNSDRTKKEVRGFPFMNSRGNMIVFELQFTLIGYLSQMAKKQLLQSVSHGLIEIAIMARMLIS